VGGDLATYGGFGGSERLTPFLVVGQPVVFTYQLHGNIGDRCGDLRSLTGPPKMWLITWTRLFQLLPEVTMPYTNGVAE
jgi:hypothetical protein